MPAPGRAAPPSPTGPSKPVTYRTAHNDDKGHPAVPPPTTGGGESGRRDAQTSRFHSPPRSGQTDMPIGAFHKPLVFQRIQNEPQIQWRKPGFGGKIRGRHPRCVRHRTKNGPVTGLHPTPQPKFTAKVVPEPAAPSVAIPSEPARSPPRAIIQDPTRSPPPKLRRSRCQKPASRSFHCFSFFLPDASFRRHKKPV